MLNKLQLIGHVGGDPEIRRTQDGRPIANFSLATSEVWKDKEGERKERTQWHRIVCFNEPLCKVIEEYVKKGSRIYVEGQSETRKWTDQQGVERYSTECVLRAFRGEIKLLDRREGRPAPSEDDYGSTKDYGGGGASAGRPSRQQELNDDIPF